MLQNTTRWQFTFNSSNDSGIFKGTYTLLELAKERYSVNLDIKCSFQVNVLNDMSFRGTWNIVYILMQLNKLFH